MRTPHRKTQVKNEQWPLIDDWYWCPMPIVKKRIDDEMERIKPIKLTAYSPLWFTIHRWKKYQSTLDARLAHACADGKIRAPSWVEYRPTKSGSVSIYGKCRHCNVPLSDSIKGIILMEREL